MRVEFIAVNLDPEIRDACECTDDDRDPVQKVVQQPADGGGRLN
jgi:hypothetical protein